MATDPSIRIVKQFTYRGGTKVFSNRYHFDNLVPVDQTHWTTLADAIVAAEKTVYTSVVSIIAAEGYDAGSDVAIFSKTYTTPGTGSWGSAPLATGDSAALLRFSTAQRSVKNHPIYLFNYIHGVASNGATTGDTLNATQKTQLENYCGLWIAGFSDGGVTHHRCGPNGHVATGSFVSPNIHHRDFPSV